MKKSFTTIYTILCFFSYAQQKQFSINWNGYQNLEAGYAKVVVPSFESNHFSYSFDSGLVYFAEWSENGPINESSVTLSNVIYNPISKSELKDLNIASIASEAKAKLINVNARGKRSVYFEINPIIKDGNSFKKIESFTINYNLGAEKRISNNPSFSSISNSVLASGEWYRFYVDTTGVHRLSKNFLGQLGVNVNSVDPRSIKIYGNGGDMLPYLNSEPSLIDPSENAIQFIGEEDGRFDNEDYILLYANGPQGFNQEQNTNINL